MKLAENLKYYREANGLTQDAVAHELCISRQSISKWETGESYPSIDNLIALRRLFNQSIDELIMGEKFLPLPFDVGQSRPAKKQFLRRPLIISILIALTITIATSSLIWGVLSFLAVLGISIFFFYTISVDLIYQHWILEKKGLKYLPPTTNFRSQLKRTLAILQKKEAQLLNDVAYNDLSSIELIYQKKDFDLFQISPFQYDLLPMMLLSTQDPFYFLITTKQGQKIKLDLAIDHRHQQVAYNHLKEICHFFENKHLPVTDSFNIIGIQQERMNLHDYLYHGIKTPLNPQN